MLTLRRLKQEDHRFKIILICIGSFRSVCAPRNQVNNLTLCFKKLEKEQTKVNTEKKKDQSIYDCYSKKTKLEKHKTAKVCKICNGTVATICLPNYRHLTLLWPCLTYWYPVSLQTKSENKPFFLPCQIPFFSGKNS